jgi:hypothetical protein
MIKSDIKLDRELLMRQYTESVTLKLNFSGWLT